MQSLNIDDNVSIMSTGNIVSSGRICATHGDFNDLYTYLFNCNTSFSYVEFDEQWSGVYSVSNLSMINAWFTLLNDVSANTFSYVSLLRSDAQTQIDNVSALATNLTTVVSNVSTTANSALSLANSLNITLDGVSRVAWSAYNNELGLAETVTNLSQNVSVYLQFE